MLTSMYFRKTGVTAGVSEWDVGIKLTDSQGNIFHNLNATTAGNITSLGLPAGMEFNGAGILNANGGDLTNNEFNLTFPLTPTGATNQTMDFNLGGLTQYGANFGVTDLTQDGYTTGQLSGIDVDQSGVISARFTNGQSNNLGQVYLTSFTNAQGLSQLGDNYWAESYASGQGIINAPGEGNAGLINSGSLEDSNVDLTEQLINLITAQRNFQANAKTITTADTITQTVIQL